MRIIKFISIVFFLSMGLYSHAQPQSLGNGLYCYNFPGTATNNIYNFNADIVTDASGNIWVAKKSFGVLKFDGVMWSGYFNRANGSLPSDTVNCMEIEGNAIYVGTVNGLAVYDGMNWSQYTMANAGLPDSSVSCISVLNANIWIGTNNGLSHKVGNNWVNYNSNNSPLPNDNIYSISQSNNGDLWVASQSGLFQFDGSSWIVFNTQNSNIGHNNILDACVDNANYLWVNVDSVGLYKLELNTFEPVEDLFPPYIINPSTSKIEKSPIEGVSHFVPTNYYQHYHSLFSFGQQLIRYNNKQLNIKYFTEDANNYWFLPLFGNKLYRFKKSEVDTYMKQVIIDANNIHAGICNRGLLFNDEFAHGSYFEAPAGSDKSTVYGTNLWVAAKDQNGALHTSVESSGHYELIWSAGPVMDSVWYKIEADKWSEPWKVYRSEVNYHILHWQDGNYQIPQSISEWPGNGDTTKGQTFQIAPFVDINFNGIYEPQSGDYPQFCGDQAIFFIFNDDRLWKNSIGQHMKVEVQAMAYEFNAHFDSALYNTLFINYKIVNRSDNDYDSLYLGIFSDFDIWYAHDDYIGTDSTLSLIYGYNANNRDFFINDSNPPATGIAFLNKPLTNSMPTNSFSNQFFPDNDSEYFDFMQSVFPNGNHLYYGGHGIDSNKFTNYIYSGLPSDTNQWSEVSNKSNPYDRKILGSTGSYNLMKDSSINLDWAIIYARNFADTNAYMAVDVLLQRTSSIQAFYQNHLADHCVNGYTSINPHELDKDVLLYPNPAYSKIYINSSDNKIQSLEIFDITAKKLIHLESISQAYGIDISSLSTGMYFIRIKIDNQFIVKKFIKR
ncbi:MAG: T9SS type A sorting domain-containing protein [Bacteroidales bacterium]|nr:T9SS type A sorting domain-containing protein [Bacteroidales bacterium]